MKNCLLGRMGPELDNKALWTFLCLIGLCSSYNMDTTTFFTEGMFGDIYPMENVYILLLFFILHYI